MAGDALADFWAVQMRETPRRGSKKAKATSGKKEASVSPSADQNHRRDVQADSRWNEVDRLDGAFVQPCQKPYVESLGGASTAAFSSSTATVAR